MIIFYNTALLFSCHTLLQFLSSNKQVILSNGKIFASLKRAACLHIQSCAAAGASERLWDKEPSHFAAGMHGAAHELGIHRNSLSHPKSLLYISTLLLRADRKAMEDFNDSKLIIPKGWKAREVILFPLSCLIFLIHVFFFLGIGSLVCSCSFLQLLLPLLPRCIILPGLVLLWTFIKHFPSLLCINPYNHILLLHMVKKPHRCLSAMLHVVYPEPLEFRGTIWCLQSHGNGKC